MNEKYLLRLQEDLRLKNFTQNTCDDYYRFTKRFLEFTGKEAMSITYADIRRFIFHMKDNESKKASTINVYTAHIHVLCTGGGLDADRNWHQKKGGFFLPGKAMAALFRGKFLSGLKALHEAGGLTYEGEAARYRNQYEFQEMLDICYRKNWVTDIRESFAGAETVMHYLGRYTHRIAIGNSRILRMDGSTVTIKVKDYRSGGQWKELTLDGVEFVRRFLMHVPPKGFVRIRHYGILSNQNKRKLIPICRNLIGCREFLRRFRKDDKAQAIRILYRKDVTVCPRCGGSMSYEVRTERGPRRSSA